MATAADTVPAAPTSGIGGIAQLLQALSPIFLGTGATTSSGTKAEVGSSTGSQTGSTVQSSVTGANPDIIASLLAQMNQANTLATSPQATQAIIDNIIRLNTQAFAPVIGQANASGIYNSSTLGLLAGEASAASTAQAASAALNFQTSEQKIAGDIGANLLTATKTQDITGSTAQNTTGNTTNNTTTNTTSQTAPVVGKSGASNLLTGLAPIAALFGLKQLGITGDGGTLDNLIGSIFGKKTTTTPGAIASDFPGIDAEGAISGIDTASTIGQGGGAIGGNLPFLDANTQPGTSAIGNAGLFSGDLANIPAEHVTPAFQFSTESIPVTSGATTDLTPSFDINAGPVETGVSTAVPGVTDAAGAVIDAASSTATGGISGVFDNFNPSSGSALNIPSDIGNIFSSGGGAADIGSLLSDIANPIAGFAGGALGHLIDPHGNSIGQSVGGTAGGAIGGFAAGELSGTAVGAEFGSFLGPIGTAAGALIGTLLGGLVGQRHPVNSYAAAQLITNPDGTLALGAGAAQAFPQYEQLKQGLQGQLDAFNSVLKTSGLKVAGVDLSGFNLPDQTKSIQLGIDRGVNSQHFGDSITVSKDAPGNAVFSDLTTALPGLRFTSDNPQLADLVSGQRFSDINSLITTLQTGKLTTAAPTASGGSNSADVSNIISGSSAGLQSPGNSGGSVDIAATLNQPTQAEGAGGSEGGGAG